MEDDEEEEGEGEPEPDAADWGGWGLDGWFCGEDIGDWKMCLGLWRLKIKYIPCATREAILKKYFENETENVR